MASSADTPRARALGAELRDARDRAGLTQRALAALIGGRRTSSHIARWENGKLIPSVEDTATLLQALGVRGEERARLLELARDARDPNWLAPGVDRQFAALTEYERTATTIINVEPLIIPGLMQTYDYARELIAAGGASTGEAEQRAQLRVGRQHVLTRPTPPRLVAFVGEYALRYASCSPGVMDEQLKHLLSLGERENVELRVMPRQRPLLPFVAGAWALMEFARTKPVVYVDHYQSSVTITEAKSVAQYREAADILRDAAMSPTASAELIASILEERRE